MCEVRQKVEWNVRRRQERKLQGMQVLLYRRAPVDCKGMIDIHVFVGPRRADADGVQVVEPLERQILERF